MKTNSQSFNIVVVKELQLRHRPCALHDKTISGSIAGSTSEDVLSWKNRMNVAQEPRNLRLARTGSTDLAQSIV